MKIRIVSIIVIVLLFVTVGVTQSGCLIKTTEDAMREQQEVITKQANDAVGLPSIVNFREKRILKDLYELRDQADLVTYTYIYSPYTGKFTFIGQTIGFGIPYATQYSNPDKPLYANTEGGAYHDSSIIAQAEPNGLYSPQSADGTWVMMLDETTGKVSPQYIEERIEVFTFKLPDSMLVK
jgi:hypothetical protein